MTDGIERSPTGAEIEAHILKLAKRRPTEASVRNVLDSVEGRPIYAVTVTDPTVRAADKQHALIIAGQHGNEESGRMVAMATIDWLLSKAGAETRRKQKVVVMPNVNPDAAARDAGSKEGGNPNRDHPPEGAKTPPGESVEIVAAELEPEMFLDCHSRGYAGCSHDMTLFPFLREYTEDDSLVHRIAADMDAAAEKSGIPQVTHPLTFSGWGSGHLDEALAVAYAYRNFKSIAMLIENSESNEHIYPLRNRRASGLEKVKALLRWGNRRLPKLQHAGYPCMLVSGFFRIGLVAVGKTAEARRSSRLAIWRNIEQIQRIRGPLPEPLLERQLTLKYSGRPLGAGVGVQFQAFGGLAAKAVTCNGRRLRKSVTNGYATWRAAGTTFIVVALDDFRRGKYDIRVTLK